MDWTEKYRPDSLSDVRGNDKSVSELREWAETWSEHREPALVYGEPGVGKTSAVHALARDMGWGVTELNASDKRTSSEIKEIAGEASRSQSLLGSDSRNLVVLDEADNLHGNADRGGAKAVTEVVKEAGQPVVLIANEYYDMSNTLRRICREIEFRNVSSRSIVPVLRDILESEGVEYSGDALERIADMNSGDLRGAINDLQAVAEGRDRLTVDDVETGARDSSEDVFGFLDTVFQGSDIAGALRDARFVDESPDDLVHWIDENMPKTYEGEELVNGYYNLARADVYLGRTMRSQNYGLWRYANDLMVGGVQAAKRGEKSGWTRYSPPSTFRRLGRTRKKRGTRDSLARKVGVSSLMSMSSVRREVFPYLTLLFGDRETAVGLVSGLGLTEEEVEYLTGWSESRVRDVVESEPVVEKEEVGDDESQSTLSSFD